jgi:VanZ family protein
MPPSRRWLSFALVVYWIGMTIGTHSPSSLVPGGTNHTDKLMHGGAFAGLTVLCCLAFDIRRFLLAGALLVAYAAVDETTQGLVGREVDILDWSADVVGICLGLVIARAVHRSRERSSRAI